MSPFSRPENPCIASSLSYFYIRLCTHETWLVHAHKSQIQSWDRSKPGRNAYTSSQTWGKDWPRTELDLRGRQGPKQVMQKEWRGSLYSVGGFAFWSARSLIGVGCRPSLYISWKASQKNGTDRRNRPAKTNVRLRLGLYPAFTGFEIAFGVIWRQDIRLKRNDSDTLSLIGYFNSRVRRLHGHMNSFTEQPNPWKTSGSMKQQISTTQRPSRIANRFSLMEMRWSNDLFAANFCSCLLFLHGNWMDGRTTVWGQLCLLTT